MLENYYTLLQDHTNNMPKRPLKAGFYGPFVKVTQHHRHRMFIDICKWYKTETYVSEYNPCILLWNMLVLYKQMEIDKWFNTNMGLILKLIWCSIRIFKAEISLCQAGFFNGHTFV